VIPERQLAANETLVEEEYKKLSKEKKHVVEGMLSPSIEEDFFFLPTADGPPGTGKTHTACIGASEYVLQDPERNKVVFFAFTNYAADRIKEELDKWFPPSVVIRLTPNVAEKDWERGRIGCDPYLTSLSREDIRRIKRAKFIVSTPFIAGRIAKIGGFSRNTLMVFDEFSQIDPPTFFSCLNGLKEISPRGISFFGDPLQLPVVTTQFDLYENIVEFLARKGGFEPYRLETQFRMHETICSVVNAMRRQLSNFSPISSGHSLVPDESVRKRTLEELGYEWRPGEARKCDPKLEQVLDPSYPFVVIDTSDLGNETPTHSGSWRNEAEAELAAKIAGAANRSFARPAGGTEDFPVLITPYAAQATLLRERVREGKVLTVYKAQGREYPFVIVSMVRNNEDANVGFLDLPYLRGQAYVALSRAKAKMIVLVSENTFAPHPVFNAFLSIRGERCLKLKW
jgi:hypothetical protein